MMAVRRRGGFGLLLCLVAWVGFAPVALGQTDAARPKYVFLMIGDGMGAAQRAVAEMYKRAETGAKPGDPAGQLVMNRFPVKGLTTTHPHKGTVTDSAAAATALACGEKTANGVVGMSADRSRKLRSIAYDAKSAGKRVGIVSSVPLDHATPACFYACEPSRGRYYEIAAQASKSGFDYFAGEPFMGAAERLLKDRPDPTSLAKEAGYTTFRNEAGLKGIQPGMGPVLWQTPVSYAIDRKPDGVSLVDLTRKGIELLDNDKGFFMMIEGGKIDWAGHANDLATNVKETLAFDDAIACVYDFYRKHPDETLIVVTGDHECGGLKTSFGKAFSPERYLSAVRNQKLSGGRFHGAVQRWEKAGGDDAAMLDEIRDTFGLADLTDEEVEALKAVFEYARKYKKTSERPAELKRMYGSKNMVVNASQNVIARRCGVTWMSFGHTGAAVGTTAVGVGSEGFAGQTDNTDIAKRLRPLLAPAAASAK